MSLKNQVEALLFSSGKAMEEEQLAAITGSEKRAVKAALKQLAKDYLARDTALKLFNEGASWKLHVHDEHIPLVRRIVADTELTKATMETLAIIAYHQPNVLQSKVVDLRGGNAYEQIRELEELGFVAKAKQGRSFSLRLTEKFYEYFDVEGEQSIRKVFQEVKAPPPKEQQRRLGALDVIDALSEAPKARRALDFEVVEPLADPPHSTVREAATAREEESGEQDAERTPPATLERDRAAEGDFLSRIESQIEQLSKRNDDLAKDESFKPMQQEGSDGQAPEETGTDSAGTDGNAETEAQGTEGEDEKSETSTEEAGIEEKEPSKKGKRRR